MSVSQERMTKTVDCYLRLPYKRVLIPSEDGGFAAFILEFPGCCSQGETAQEAYEAIEDSARGWIAACLDLGRRIPKPDEYEAGVWCKTLWANEP